MIGLYCMEKRSCIILCLFLVFGVIIQFMPFVSAYSYYGGFGNFDLRTGSEQLIQFITDFARPLFEGIIGDYSGSEFFFAKCLILILLYVVCASALKRVEVFKKNNGVIFIISAVISVLAVRFISENQLTLGILLPYGTLGVALTTILPFFIFTFFIQVSGMGGLGRRLSWLFFGIVFIVLWFSKSSEMAALSNQIYFFTLIGMIVAFIFDKQIHYYFKAWELSAFYKNSYDRTAAKLQAEYLNIVNVDTPEAERSRQRIEQELKRMNRSLP